MEPAIITGMILGIIGMCMPSHWWIASVLVPIGLISQIAGMVFILFHVNN